MPYRGVSRSPECIAQRCLGQDLALSLLKLQAYTFPAFHGLGGNRERSASDRLQKTAQAKAPTTESRTREMSLVNGDSRPLGQGILTIRVKALVLGCRFSSRGRHVAPLQCCPLVLAVCPGSCVDFGEPSPLLLQRQGAVLPDEGLPSVSCLALSKLGPPRGSTGSSG